jgi:arylsulfatase A-like enzyme
MRAIVFILRRCPAAWLGAYGNAWVATPNLDRLAAEAVVFDRHISDCPDPEAARRVWLTGRCQIPAIEPHADPRPTDSPSIPTALRTAGVYTACVRANHPDTDAPAPFYAGWGEVFDARPQAEDASPLDALIRSLPSLLDRLAPLPRWLVWVEIDRLIPPWEVPAEVFEAYVEEEDAENPEDEPEEPVVPFADPPTGPFDRADFVLWEWLHSTFAAVLTTLDAELGRVFEELRRRGLDQTATWIVASDLGYPLGEHGQVGPSRPWLHEELVHLPLIVRLPAAAEGGRRVPGFTQPADLAATMLDLFGLMSMPEDVHGHSLLPLARGEKNEVREYACSGLELNGAAEWSIRIGESALLLPGRLPPDDPPRAPQLFEKPDDRWEVNDLRSRHLERAEELEPVLRLFVAAVHRPGPLILHPSATAPG